MSRWLSSLVSSFRPASAESTEDATAELTISRIITYPVKSCAGIELPASNYTIAGLEYDRQWMIIEESTHKMVTARTPGTAKLFLVQIRLDIEAGKLHLKIPHEGDFTVPLAINPEDEAVDGLQVWGSYDLVGHIVSPVGSPLQAALTSFLGMSVLLIRSTNSEAPRVLGGQKFLDDVFNDAEDLLDYPLEEITTLYADGYPYLVATEATFVQVEKLLIENTKDIRMDPEELVQRYRPNIVVKGNKEGFEEDGWEELRLGDETFYPVSRCPRCPMPDSSPIDGTMSIRRMPGTIVSKYRSGVDKIHKGPCLGMNMLSKARSGRLQVGAKVQVVRQAGRPDKLDPNRCGEWLRVEDKW